MFTTIVSVIVRVLVFGTGFGVGFGAANAFGAGEQIASTQRCAASADFGMLAICDELGQLTTSTTGLVTAELEALAAGFGAALGFGGTGTVTVLVIVCVVDDPGEEVDEPTQTVTDPEPIFEP
ncbi:MAG: hypothetical protein NT044_00700 [Micrococcales bacterium]|nr:hypothetical protein [Micrococcales bacterium]